MIRKNAFLSLLIFEGFFMSCKENTSEAAKEVTEVAVEFKKEAEIYLTKPEGDTIQHLDIEIADNDYQRETGLMYRQDMQDDRGMLFIFEDEQPRWFYMKNTDISLDLIFLNAQNKIISISKNAQPRSMATIASEGPAQYVLEINAGLADQWNLQPGDSLILNRE